MGKLSDFPDLPPPYKGDAEHLAKIEDMKKDYKEVPNVKPLFANPFKLPEDDDSGDGLEMGGKRRKTRRGKRSRKTKKRKQKKSKQSRRRRRSKK